MEGRRAIMMRGRPRGSIIRENIAKILFVIREGYGYEIYQIYKNVFSKVSLRSVYYNLEKGSILEEFEISRAEKAAGSFSWGKSSERNYYMLKSKMVAPESGEIERIRRAKHDAYEKLIKK